MKEIKGTYSTAKVFTDNIDERTYEQIEKLCSQEYVEGQKIRIMPDTHAGVGCVIGTTMTINDKIVPNLVGVDIGCGMLTVELPQKELDFKKLDKFIRENIPHGRAINDQPQVDFKEKIQSLRCIRDTKKSSREFNRAIGSLGGGNHFIEIDKGSDGKHYLVIHSGSRNLGNQVATIYQNRAYEYHSGLDDDFEKDKQELISRYKAEGRRKELQEAIKNLRQSHKKESEYPKDLCYVEGQLFEDYIHDMQIMQEYAVLNREVMGRNITEKCFGWDYKRLKKFQTIHNYIDIDNMILRKGAVSAEAGERLLIPMNMRDGSLVCRGLRNPDWNCSAPHGAGRIMSRSKARDTLDLTEFKQTMKGIYSTSVRQETLDEAPMVYKPMDEIMENIKDTVEVLDIIKPLYNFKA
jgi:RNA-splicing ligase RtcB